jgi:peptidoglycan/xylan/chitin deacetylase (PgdA/CDA1 family)
LFIYFYSKVIFKKSAAFPGLWEISKSSKNLNYHKEGKVKMFLFLLVRKIMLGMVIILNKIGLSSYPDVTVFCYHSVSENDWRFSINKEMFKKQIEWLIKRFVPITVADLEEYLRGNKKFTKPSFVLAFDDGYKDNLAIIDYLNSKKIKPIFFAMSDTKNASSKELQNKFSFLNKDDLRVLVKSGWAIGSHSATHQDFSCLSHNDIKNEITGSKNELQGQTGAKIKYFAYPKGAYNKDIIKAVKNAGYDLAFSLDDEVISVKTNPYAVPRVGVDRTHSFSEFKVVFSVQAIFLRRKIRRVIRMLSETVDRITNSKIIQTVLMFFANRLVTINRKHYIELPKSIDNYRMIDTIDRPKGDNQYQFGIYENDQGRRGILKMWDGKKKDGDWFWLSNEIKTYEGLSELFKANKSMISEKFGDVKLPKLIKRLETKNTLGLFMEQIDGKTLDHLPDIKDVIKAFDKAINYFRYLGELIAWNKSEAMFVKRTNAHTVAIFIYMLMRSIFMYPKKSIIILYSLLVFMKNLSYLMISNDLAFVHRDLTYKNILKLPGEKIGIIDFELAVLTNPLYEITQIAVGSWRHHEFREEFYRLDIMKEIMDDKNKFYSYKALTIFTAIHRLATSPRRQFDLHYAYLMHGLGLKLKNDPQIYKSITNLPITNQ